MRKAYLNGAAVSFGRPLHVHILQHLSHSSFSQLFDFSTGMDPFNDPRIDLLPRYSSYYSRSLNHTLTNDEFMDNVLFAISIFLLVILLKDIITRIVYMRPRFSVARDRITYFSQARIVLLDNSYFLRRMWRFWLFDAGHYKQRNHMQYYLVLLATLAMFTLEFGLVLPGLPANKPIYRDSDKIVRWESEYLDKGRIVMLEDGPCIVTPVVEGPNIKSVSSWSFCRDSLHVPASFAIYPSEMLFLTVSNPDKTSEFLAVLLHGERTIISTKYEVSVPLGDTTSAHVGLSDNATTFTRNLQRNFHLLRNVSGLTLTTPLNQPVDTLLFYVNASQVQTFKRGSSAKKIFHADLWITAIIQGILTLRASDNGSHLYNLSKVPMKKTKLLVGVYIGTLVPAFFVVSFTTGALLIYIVVRILLRSPPGGSWELFEAHRREHGDRILAGSTGDVINIHANEEKRQGSPGKDDLFIN